MTRPAAKMKNIKMNVKMYTVRLNVKKYTVIVTFKFPHTLIFGDAL